MKINMCCGRRDFGKDWIHIDGGDYPHLNYKDVTKLIFEDNSIDLIYCSHGIAYWDRDEIIPVLREWRRVLKPGGVLRLATPDFETMAKMYSLGAYSLVSFLGPIYGRMSMGNHQIYHKICYDSISLTDLLMNCGFKDIKEYDWRKTEHSQFDDHSQAYLPHFDKENGVLLSLNMECKK